MLYKVQRGLVTVTARSAPHDTTTRYPKLDGTIEFDADNPRAARAEIAIDMRVFDTGDKLKNWKLKSAHNPDEHPTAIFTMARFEDIHEMTAGQWNAVASGQLKWRGRAPMVKVSGKASVDRRGIDAQASFSIDMRELGVQPPEFFLLKVEEVVLVQVALAAFATGK